MKLQEMREQTVEEIEAKILLLRRELFDLNVQKATFKLENSSELSKKKRIIAQLKTIIREKQLSK